MVNCYIPKTKQDVGIDLGINRLITLSNGECVSNPKYLNAQSKKIIKAQKILARRKKGSKRWERARLRVAKINIHVVDARIDYLHKVTTNLVRRFDTICIEDLDIHGMAKNHSLAGSLFDTSLGTLTKLLICKCEWYGKTLIKVNRFFPSSKRCNKCGRIVESLPLHVREWDCPECKTHHDRDLNAALNILAEGHSVSARGGHVRRVKAKALNRNDRRSVNQPRPLGIH